MGRGQTNRSTDLARRREWAERNGHPAWLWPEVERSEWRGALVQLGHVLQSVLSGGDQPTLSGCPRAMGLAAYTSGLGPMLGWWIERGTLATAAPVADVFATHLDHNRRRMALLLEEAVNLVDRLAESGVRAVVLKGMHTATAYFPEPGVRPMSDIDLLIDGEDEVAAGEVLLAEGFVSGKRTETESTWRKAGTATEPKNLLFVDAADPWSIDLHRVLRLEVSPGCAPAALDAADPLRSAVAWLPAPDAGCLSQPLLLLHLAVHAGTGLHNLTLLRLLELVQVIRRDTASGDLDWNAFVAVARQTGSLGFAYPALALCRRLAADTVPEAVLAACRAAAPARAVRVVEPLTPATAQRVDRTSIREHFMWTRGLPGWSRQLAADLLPRGGSLGDTLSLYRSRGWRVLRGGMSR